MSVFEHDFFSSSTRRPSLKSLLKDEHLIEQSLEALVCKTLFHDFDLH